MGWKAYYRESDGKLLSVASVHPASLPAGVATKDISAGDKQRMWDAATRAFVDRPLKDLTNTDRDLLKKIKTHPKVTAAWAKLTATEKQKFKEALDEIFGGPQWRWA